MKRKLSAFMVALCLLLTGIPGAPMKANAAEAEKESASVDTSALAALPAYQPEGDCKILSYVHADVFAQGDHVARLHEEESLSSYAFLNRDGTKTVYYLDEVVKFEAADGRILEKDLTLRSEKGGYATTQNDVSLHLPVSPASGVRLSYNNKQVTLVPQGGSATAASDGKAVRYANYYGPGMDLVYTPTMDGVKEEIILSAYSGVNSFTFLLNTGGLNLYQSANRYFLAESKLSDSKIWLGTLEIFDAAIQPGPGEMTVETVMPGQQYRITLTVDEDYLTDPNTLYPVTIDPTLTVSDNTHGAGAIEDAPIYEGYPTSNFGSYQYNRAGYAGTTYKKGRTVVRLTGLLNNAAYINLRIGSIQSVKFYIADASGTSNVCVNLHLLTSNSTWTESSVTWESVGDNLAISTGSATPTANSYAVFNLTETVKLWKEGKYSEGQCGFLLVGKNESTVDKSLYSSEHTTTTKRPYVVVTSLEPVDYYYHNYYDATVSGNYWFHSGVSYAIETADGAFSRLFPVRFYQAGSVDRRTDAYPEHCGAGSSSPCTTSSCTADCDGAHHKNANRVGNQILSWPRPDNTISVLWTNYPSNVYCRSVGTIGHDPISANATTNFNGLPAILVMNIDGSTTEYKKAFMAYLLTHETVHSFGMPDVYTKPSDEDDGENKPVGHDVVGWKCMMEYHEPNKINELVVFCERVRNGEDDAFCTSCKSALQNNYVPGAYFEGNQ